LQQELGILHNVKIWHKQLLALFVTILNALNNNQLSTHQVQYLKQLKIWQRNHPKKPIQKWQRGLSYQNKCELVIWVLEKRMGKQQILVCKNVVIIDIHKKKSCPFSLSHIATIVRFEYISITFSYLKFVNELLD
jgi:hypothetical protein